jgi:hypothetical protein
MKEYCDVGENDEKRSIVRICVLMEVFVILHKHKELTGQESKQSALGKGREAYELLQRCYMHQRKTAYHGGGTLTRNEAAFLERFNDQWKFV